MEEVASCSVCKSLYEDNRFTDLNGALLENVIKIKLLGDIPIDTTALGLRGESKICRDCLELVDDIRLGLIKLKERVLKRHYPHHAQFLIGQHAGGGFGSFGPNRRNSPSSVALCDSAEDGEGTSSSETESSSFCDKNSVNFVGERYLDRRSSATSLIGDPHLVARVNSDRDVRIRVPPSINATFIVMETSDEELRCNNASEPQLNKSPLPKSVQSLLKKNKISDVIDTSSFKHAYHVDVGAKLQRTDNNPVEVPKPQTTEVSLPVKRDNPVPVPREYTHYIKKRRLSYSAGDSSMATFAQTVRTDSNIDKSSSSVCSRSLTTSPVREVNGNSNHSPTHVQEATALDLTRPAHAGEMPDQTKKDVPSVGKSNDSPNGFSSVPKQVPVSRPYDRFSRLMENANGQASPPILPVRKRRSLGNILEMRRTLPTPPPPVPLMSSEMCNGDVESRHVCDVCGRGFERQSLLNQHIAWHHTDHGYSCNLCGMKFGEKFGLHIHESQEHNMRPMIPLMLPPPIPPLPPEQSMTSSPQIHAPQEPSQETAKPHMDMPVHISKEAFLKSRKKIQYCEDCREHFTSKYDLLRHRVTTGHMGGAEGVCHDREEASSTSGIDTLQRQKRIARMPRQGMPNPGQPLVHYPPILPKTGENPLGMAQHPTDLDHLAYRPGRKGRPRKSLPGSNRRMSVPNLMLAGSGSDGLRAYDFSDDNSDPLPIKTESYETGYNKDSQPNSPGSSTRTEQKLSPNQDNDMVACGAEGHNVHLNYVASSPQKLNDNNNGKVSV
ncbi:uncharacterized protein LOC135486242 [Lineus longissimus]|uniref:uncharacterized protein LOC135486242 n=1 Tax=Lineus longissimus TaxID=88925 RepID=UPI002B4E6DB9